jgi:hypothetical protein
MTGHKEPITAEGLQFLIDYMDEGEPDIQVVKSELSELILRSTGEYWEPKTKVIDWSKVNTDIVPVKHTVGQAFYVNDLANYKDIELALVTGKKIAWTGGECPLPEGVMVRRKLRCGALLEPTDAEVIDWTHTKSDLDIIWFEVTGYADGYEWGEV